MQYLLDSDTCIKILRGRANVVRRVAALSPNDCAVSVITAYELYTGVEKCADPAKERPKVEQLLANVHLLAFDERAARMAATVRGDLERQGCPIGPYDTLIAAHALCFQLALATSNMQEFSRISGLQLENWDA